MLFGLLAVVAIESRKMPWKIRKIVIILNRTMCALYKAYMYVSKSCVEQCLMAFVFMLVMKLAFTKFTRKQV